MCAGVGRGDRLVQRRLGLHNGGGSVAESGVVHVENVVHVVVARGTGRDRTVCECDVERWDGMFMHAETALVRPTAMRQG